MTSSKLPHAGVCSALSVVKGAVSVVFGLPPGRTTKSVKFQKSTAAALTVGPVLHNPTDLQIEELKLQIEQKIMEDDCFRVFTVPRSISDNIYGDAVYDDFGVPQNVTELRIVCIDKWNINANVHPILRRTGILKNITITSIKHNTDKNTLEIRFGCETSEDVTEENTILGNSSSENYCSDNYPSADQILPIIAGESSLGLEDKNLVVTPWTVSATDVINYDKLIVNFGCSHIDENLVKRIEQLSGKIPVHRFLRRGIFFSHRDLHKLLDNYERGSSFYVYTGRGPSSQNLHIGHLVPFYFTKWLQDAFNVPVVIQITDDEKYLFKESLCTVEGTKKLGYENIKDIIACGFDVKKTFIFSDIDYIQHMYPLVLKIQKRVTCSQARGIFGFAESDNIGKYGFPAVQAAPSFSECFPTLLENNNRLWSLIPQAIDQDPYFRMTRDVAPRIGCLKPALVHSKFIPALQGFQTKMSSSVDSSTIYVTDSDEEIARKIRKYAFSGGKDTVEEHRIHGADLSIDVPYQYLRYWMEDDNLLDEIGHKYSKGEMLTGDVKEVLINELCKIVKTHRINRAEVTDELIKEFTNPNRSLLHSL